MAVQYINVARGVAAASPLIKVPIQDRRNPTPWTKVSFDYEYSDSAGHHPSGDSPIIAYGGTSGAYVHGTLDLWLVDFTSGTELQIRQYEEKNGTRAETALPHEFYAPSEHDKLPSDDPDHDPSVCHHRYPVMAYVNPGHALGIEITQFHDSPTYEYPAGSGTFIPFRVGVIRKAQFLGTVDPR